MTNRHQLDHDTLLQRVVQGLEPPDREDFVSHAEHCEECARVLAEFATTQQALDSAGEQHRQAILLEAEQTTNFVGDERMEQTLQELTKPHRGHNQRVRRLLWLLTAAAAAVLLWLQFRSEAPQTDVPTEEVYLGVESLVLLTPIGAVHRFENFQWQTDIEGSTELRIYDDTESGAGDLLLELRELSETEWAPTDRQRQQWPPAIRWEVEILDPTSSSLALTESKAWIED